VTQTSTATPGATPTPAWVTCGARDEAPRPPLLLRLETSSSHHDHCLHQGDHSYPQVYTISVSYRHRVL
jgi:hypothetical protein